MAFRSRSRARRSAPRKRAIWVNIPFGAVAFTESIGVQLLLTGEDWEAQFTGLANEKAVLRTVVGALIWSQTVAGTTGGNGFWGIFVADNNVASPVPAFTTTGMSEVDWLWVGCRKTASTVAASVQESLYNGTEYVHIKTKRRLTSRDGVFICAQFANDAAAPAGTLSGLLRFLVARD